MSLTLDHTALRAAADGAALVLAPADAGFDAAQQILAGGVRSTPGAVVRPADAGGVARAIRFAREHDVELVVRSGGHSALGRGRHDGALVLDLRGLDAVTIDPSTRTATAGGGVTAASYTAAAAEHGLATPFGDTGTVGVAGITLGGGVGFLSRRLGMTVDSLRSAEVVTADGETLHADSREHPDLFWGLRGGGGNLGVVTRLTFDLHAQGEIVGGPLVLAATAASVAGVITALREAPRELAAVVMVMVAPPMPFLPPEVHGRLICLVNLCWSGAPDAAESAVAPLRAIGADAGGVLADLVRTGPYLGLLEGPEGPPFATRLRSFFADDLDEAVASELVAALESGTAPMRAVQLRVLGGAVADVAEDATAFAHRDAVLTGAVLAAAPTPEQADEHTGWVGDLADRIRAGRPGAYVNFVPDGDPALLAEAYPGRTGTRLAQVKAAYDPQNLFRGNLNVPPSRSA
ncbi:FAD-binding oxidoreductase [Isoptericola aurantiacus]|uniref:FAD-binding oxidoreductase n=1 Tax=Isoptericola aurantiacus TaxID=3377839 RepID=UPI00383BF3BA